MHSDALSLFVKNRPTCVRNQTFKSTSAQKNGVVTTIWHSSIYIYMIRYMRTTIEPINIKTSKHQKTHHIFVIKSRRPFITHTRPPPIDSASKTVLDTILYYLLFQLLYRICSSPTRWEYFIWALPSDMRFIYVYKYTSYIPTLRSITSKKWPIAGEDDKPPI